MDVTTLNPNAPPGGVSTSPSGGEAGVNAFRQGNVAIMPAVGAVLPDRCVVCNAPAGGFRLHKKFRFQHVREPESLVLDIAVPYEHRRASVALGLCPQHRARRRNGFILAGIGFLFGLATLIAGMKSDAPEGMLVLSGGAVVMMVLPAVGVFMARVAYPTRIDQRYMWLKVGQPFVEGLPPVPVEVRFTP